MLNKLKRCFWISYVLPAQLGHLELEQRRQQIEFGLGKLIICSCVCDAFGLAMHVNRENTLPDHKLP